MPAVGLSASFGVSTGVARVLSGGRPHDKPGVAKLTSTLTGTVTAGFASTSTPLTWSMFASSVGPHPTPGPPHVAGNVNATISGPLEALFEPKLDGNVTPNMRS